MLRHLLTGIGGVYAKFYWKKHLLILDRQKERPLYCVVEMRGGQAPRDAILSTWGSANGSERNRLIVSPVCTERRNHGFQWNPGPLQEQGREEGHIV